MQPQLVPHFRISISVLIFSIVLSAFFPPQVALSQVGATVAFVPEPQIVEFSLDSPRDVPEDIQEQITWFVGQFGGGGDCIEGIEALHNYSAGSRNVSVTADRRTWCVRDSNLSQQFVQSLNARITLPDGSEQMLPLNIDSYDNESYPYILFTYEFGPGSQLGRYTVEVSSGDTNWADEFNLFILDRPTVDFNYDPELFVLDNVWLIGFEPHDHVRTLVYDGNFDLYPIPDVSQSGVPFLLTFLAEQGFELDENGMLVISFAQVSDNYNPMLIVLDEATNRIIDTNIRQEIEIGEYTVMDSIFDSCTEVVSPHLAMGDTARVTSFNEGLPLRVRSDPGLSGEFLTSLPEGTLVEVLVGPSCIDGYWWWGIQTADGLWGWAAEGDDVDYFLEGVP